MSKIKTFYGVRTTDDEMHSSFKAYAETRELAVEELKKHCDWFASNPPEPDEWHIVPMQMLATEDDNQNKEFVLERISERIFIIATKDQFDESGTVWLKFPMKIHGFIKVEGKSFEHSFAGYMHISDDVTSNELDRLSVLARNDVFNKKL